jgi:hypothetical protein
MIAVPDVTYPGRIAGERCCPPEDGGGIGGYKKYPEAMANPDHEEHEDMTAWRGPFAPEAFSLDRVNQELASKFGPARKPVVSKTEM